MKTVIVKVNALFIPSFFLSFDFPLLLHIGFARQMQSNLSPWVKWLNSIEVFGPRALKAY